MKRFKKVLNEEYWKAADVLVNASAMEWKLTQ